MKIQKKEKISTRVIERLTRYLKCLEEFLPESFISSEEMARILGITAAQIRKDLSNFIPDFEFNIGIRGKGYQVRSLHNSIRKILGVDKTNNVVILGSGKFTSAILTEPDFIRGNFNVAGVFDITKSRVGKDFKDMKVRSVDELEAFVLENNVTLAIIATSKGMAQEMADVATGAGIKGILNFTPVRVKGPKTAALLNVDITSKLQELNYWREQLAE